ncbi:MAG: type II toxin-antitoxin system VapC family toxin [Desulfurococcales archaeon]|nr:type II toxin-antitoxin system VapC family toxin [Desulfurococcales archaeon]
MDARQCVYVNTSVVIRALNPEEPSHRGAQQIIEDCCTRCQCIYSSVHAHEMPSRRFDELAKYLNRLGARYAIVDVETIEAQAIEIVKAWNLTESRIPDIMHMLAAKMLGCRYLLARDRFMWRHAFNFGLAYVNWETHGGKCPCSSVNPSASGRAGISKSGGRS